MLSLQLLEVFWRRLGISILRLLRTELLACIESSFLFFSFSCFLGYEDLILSTYVSVLAGEVRAAAKLPVVFYPMRQISFDYTSSIGSRLS
jgi:hypothetical protein